MNWISLLGLEAFVLRWRAAALEGAIAIEDRAELARLEWHEQKARLRQLLLLTLAVGGLMVVALTLLSVALLVQFWDSPHRTLVAWLLAVGWLLAWGVALSALVRVANAASNAFALTREELVRDWREIKEQL